MPQSPGGLTPAGRNMRAHGSKHVTDEALRRPVGERDGPPGATHTRELGRGLLLVGRKHDSDTRQHGVEGRVVELQILGVSLSRKSMSRPSAAARASPRSSRAGTQPLQILESHRGPEFLSGFSPYVLAPGCARTPVAGQLLVGTQRSHIGNVPTSRLFR